MTMRSPSATARRTSLRNLLEATDLDRVVGEYRMRGKLECQHLYGERRDHSLLKLRALVVEKRARLRTIDRRLVVRVVGEAFAREDVLEDDELAEVAPHLAAEEVAIRSGSVRTMAATPNREHLDPTQWRDAVSKRILYVRPKPLASSTSPSNNSDS